jgi:hypothetical protein
MPNLMPHFDQKCFVTDVVGVFAKIAKMECRPELGQPLGVRVDLAVE